MHPIALELLGRMNVATEGLRSKSWDEFALPGLRVWTSSSPSAIRVGNGIAAQLHSGATVTYGVYAIAK
jgi:hypothetical protein